MKESKKGISLIVLLITIIVMAILLTTVVLSVKKQHVTDASYEVRLTEKIESYRVDLEDYVARKEFEEGTGYNRNFLYADKTSIIYNGNTVEGNIFSILNSMTEEDSKILKIDEGRLIYAPEADDFDKEEFDIATKCGIVSYSKQGLVGYYEAKNNAGGTHSNTAVKWKDLSLVNNDGNILKKDNTCWGDNYFSTDGFNYMVTFPIRIPEGQDFTIEVVYKNTGSGDTLIEINGTVTLTKIPTVIPTERMYKVMYIYDAESGKIDKYGIDCAKIQDETVFANLTDGVSYISIPRDSSKEYYSIRVYNRKLLDKAPSNAMIDALRFEEIS